MIRPWALCGLFAIGLSLAPGLWAASLDRHVTGSVVTVVQPHTAYLTDRTRVARACVGAPRISSDIDLRAPTLTTRLSPAARRANAMAQGGSLRTSGGMSLRGLAQMDYGFSVSVQMERVSAGSHHCIRVTDVTVSAGEKPPTIWINPELRRGSCAYRVTLDHERAHVGNFHDHLRRFEASLRSDLPRKLGRGLSADTSEPAAFSVLEARLKAQLVQMVSALHDRSQRISERKDAAMDTPANYRRLSRMCP